MTRWTAYGPVALALTIGIGGVASAPAFVQDRVLPPSSFEAIQIGGADRDLSSNRHGVPAAALDSAWDSSPFREDRRLPSRRYDPDRAAEQTRAASEAALPPPARPDWTLTGVLLGQPPLALFDHVSGAQASTEVVAVGDELEGFTIVRIRPDSVTVSRRGVTWLYTIGSPW